MGINCRGGVGINGWENEGLERKERRVEDGEDC